MTLIHQCRDPLCKECFPDDLWNNELHEYREQSYEKVKPLETGFLMWRPDKDANQMLMVWEWLKKTGGRKEVIPIFLAYVSKDESLFDATMKAFMEYIKQK